MPPLLKKVLLAVAILLVLFIGALAAVFAPVFAGNLPMVDAQQLGGFARTVQNGYVSAFVMPIGGSDFALIDCNDETAAPQLLAELKRRGAGPDNVKAIFLTHGHPDHTAGCQMFKSADVYAFEEDVALAGGNGQPKGALTSKLPFPKEKAVKVSRKLVDGASVVVGDLEVRAFHVPGHTGGSAAFLVKGLLFLGDNATSKSDGRIVGAPWMFSDDPKQNVESVKRLAARLKSENAPVKTLVFAHSGPVDGLDKLEGIVQ